tara:strand:+ start:13808 stop:14383 length:576 start_codon:yes stop_codon:yes gene_type:complete
MSIYASSDGIQKALFTKGGEYLLDGEDYVGFYHVHPDKGPMVGKVHVPEPHKRLVSIEENPLIVGYKNAYTESDIIQVSQNTALPFTFIPNPSDEDFENGFITRYFIAKRNDYNKLYETSEKEYPRKIAGLPEGLYAEMELDWHITKNLEQESSIAFMMTTESKNKKVVDDASKIIPTLKNYLSDLTQFSR